MQRSPVTRETKKKLINNGTTDGQPFLRPGEQ
jgi:hypothetical protein